MVNEKGFIFLCSDATEQECLNRSLFGGTEKYAPRVRGLQKKAIMYLYNQQSKKLIGIFKAVSDVALNIEPQAWNGTYPLQVKVKRVFNGYKPLSRYEIPPTILKFDRSGRPSSHINVDQMRALEQLFKSKKRTPVYRNDIQILTKDGHRVMSRPEQEIDDWLYSHEISHGYATPIPGSPYYCDFEIPIKDGKIYIEYWGLNDKKYLENKTAKISNYRKNKLKLISLHKSDLKNLDKVLSKITATL